LYEFWNLFDIVVKVMVFVFRNDMEWKRVTAARHYIDKYGFNKPE